MPERLNVLVVDDDPVIRECVVESLREDRHFAVVEAATKDEMVAALMWQFDPCVGIQFDAVILDLLIPGSSGTQTIKIARQLTNVPGSPPTAIVVLSGTGLGYEEAIEAGADDYIEKGSVAQTFAQMLIEKIRHSRARNRSRPFPPAVDRLNKMADITDRIVESLK